LTVVGNENLTTLEALRSLQMSGANADHVKIWRNPQLPTAEAEELVDSLNASGDICGNQGDEGPWEDPSRVTA
jgi:hypothetical protein